MTSVVLVHGTGVRAPSYDRTFDRFSRELARVRPDVRTVPCFWGEAHGAFLALGGASLPLRGKDRGFGGEPAWDGSPAQDDPLDVWALLEVDPFAELRAFGTALASDDAEGFVPGRLDPWDDVADQVQQLSLAELPVDPATAGEGVRQLVADLAPFFGEATDRVAQEISHVLGGTPFAAGIESVAARAVLAAGLHLAESVEEADEPLPVDGADRDALVRLLAERLGGADRGVGAIAKWTGARLATPVLWPLSSVARWQRGRLTAATVPAGGDILRYQARGGELRATIADAVRTAASAAPGPVVLVAHSLGGIACVDLFADGSAGPPPGVDLLVTAGSQAPFLYELDALATLRRGEQLPAAFPRWLNVYDERDLLAFVGEKVFPGRVTDVRVDTRQPFPRSHSAYFAHRGLYELLAAELP